MSRLSGIMFYHWLISAQARGLVAPALRAEHVAAHPSLTKSNFQRVQPASRGIAIAIFRETPPYYLAVQPRYQARGSQPDWRTRPASGPGTAMRSIDSFASADPTQRLASAKVWMGETHFRV